MIQNKKKYRRLYATTAAQNVEEKYASVYSVLLFKILVILRQKTSMKGEQQKNKERPGHRKYIECT